MSPIRDRRRLPSKSQTTIRAIAVFLACVILPAVFYTVGRKLENQGPPETRGDYNSWRREVPTVTYRGETYRAREKVTSILFIGVDQEESPTGGGQADFLLLLVIDGEAKTVTPLQIDRDTLTEIAVLNILGKPTGTRRLQICLSHGFGDTADQSRELTKDAVEKLLLGTNIDYCAAVNLNGISALNDAIGGVTVTLEDDFSSLDPAMKRGVTLTLRGDQAEYYVRQRYGIADGSNTARMIRQENYLTRFRAALDARIQFGTEFIGTLFDALAPYMTTDIKRGRMINIAWKTQDYSRAAIYRPKGEYVYGDDGFVEFHADEASIEKLVVDLFYQPD